MNPYDPFARGGFPVGVRTLEALDTQRTRLFPCEIWYPAAALHAGEDLAPATRDAFHAPFRETASAQLAVRNAAAAPGTYPLILFSHSSGQHRRMATFLCTHLSSHGYVVAALDHSEVVAPALGRREGESDQQRRARVDAWIANRVPDIRFLLNYLLAESHAVVQLDASHIGIVGHSFGGWAALAATGEDPRLVAVVALAPGGSSRPKPGIIPVTLTFDWDRDVPTLYLAAENDTMTPLAGIRELFDRTPATKQLVVLRRADHMHFMDDVEHSHELVRTLPWSGELAWISEEVQPMAELCSGEQAHVFVRGLTLCHFDAHLKRLPVAQRFLAGNIEGELAARGVDAFAQGPGRETRASETRSTG
jgi:predicted dienelactone hydrolase